MPSPMSSARHAPRPSSAICTSQPRPRSWYWRACRGSRAGPPARLRRRPHRHDHVTARRAGKSPSATTSIGIPVWDAASFRERRRQCFVGGKRPTAARDQAADLLELRRVDRHPLAAKPHERRLEMCEWARRPLTAGRPQARPPIGTTAPIPARAARAGDHPCGRAARRAPTRMRAAAALPRLRQLRRETTPMPASANAGAASVRKVHASAASRSTAPAALRASRARWAGRVARQWRGRGAILLCGVEAMPEAAERLPLPEQHLLGRDEQTRIVGPPAGKAQRKFIRLRPIAVGESSRKHARGDRPPRRARAGSTVEIADERALLEPFRLEAASGPQSAMTSRRSKGMCAAFCRTRAQADCGAHQRIGGRVEERPKSASGVQTSSAFGPRRPRFAGTA